jgi:hypothetical protein
LIVGFALRDESRLAIDLSRTGKWLYRKSPQASTAFFQSPGDWMESDFRGSVRRCRKGCLACFGERSCASIINSPGKIGRLVNSASPAHLQHIDEVGRREKKSRRGALTVSAKTSIAAHAAILTALAASAFAGDRNPATELQDSGRYFGIDYTANPQHLSGTHASAANATRDPASIGPAKWDDFDLQ